MGHNLAHFRRPQKTLPVWAGVVVPEEGFCEARPPKFLLSPAHWFHPGIPASLAPDCCISSPKPLLPPPCSVICYSKVAAPSLFPRTNCLVPSWRVTGTAMGDSRTPTPHPYGNHRTKTAWDLAFGLRSKSELGLTRLLPPASLGSCSCRGQILGPESLTSPPPAMTQPVLSVQGRSRHYGGFRPGSEPTAEPCPYLGFEGFMLRSWGLLGGHLSLWPLCEHNVVG